MPVPSEFPLMLLALDFVVRQHPRPWSAQATLAVGVGSALDSIWWVGSFARGRVVTRFARESGPAHAKLLLAAEDAASMAGPGAGAWERGEFEGARDLMTAFFRHYAAPVSSGTFLSLRATQSKGLAS